MWAQSEIIKLKGDKKASILPVLFPLQDFPFLEELHGEVWWLLSQVYVYVYKKNHKYKQAWNFMSRQPRHEIWSENINLYRLTVLFSLFLRQASRFSFKTTRHLLKFITKETSSPTLWSISFLPFSRHPAQPGLNTSQNSLRNMHKLR